LATLARAAREVSPLRFANLEFENKPQTWLEELESEILPVELEMFRQGNRENLNTAPKSS